ncbi:DUF932 domain-containing protein [Chroococcidiopsis sp.]|uniref:DUF932 domain-containing protein n=1 Tax=Chroococcidiopsis sp. TaxID=3088168 RepID=UPI003F317A6D
MNDWNRQTGIAIESGASVQSILDAANLNWEVEVSPERYGHFGEYTSPDSFVAFRSDNGMKLSNYGASRKPLQNREVIGMFSDFLNKAGLEIDTVGTFANGRELWASVDLPTQYDIDVRKVGDITKAKLMLIESHALNKGLQIMVYYDRLACTNGMTQKLSTQAGVIAHTGKISSQTVSAVLENALKSVKLKGSLYEQFAQKTMSVEEATLQLISAFGDVDKPLDDQPSEVVKTALRLFQGDAKGGDTLAAYNTAYGLLQSVTEYFNHHTRSQTLENRFASVVSGDYAKSMAKFEKQLVRAYL